jgi:hypothetical protein
MLSIRVIIVDLAVVDLEKKNIDFTPEQLTNTASLVREISGRS